MKVGILVDFTSTIWVGVGNHTFLRKYYILPTSRVLVWDLRIGGECGSQIIGNDNVLQRFRASATHAAVVRGI